MGYAMSSGSVNTDDPQDDPVERPANDFQIIARRNKLLGLWAAGLMNMQGAVASSYVRQVISADLDEPGDEDVIRKVLGDFALHHVGVSRAELCRKLDELAAEARRQLAAF